MSIEGLKRKYKNEWLLIEVSHTDARGKPMQGKLVFHSKQRAKIYEKQRCLKGNLYIVYSGRVPQKGYAAAFSCE